MNSDQPNIVAQQGTVEDWIIENRHSELHDFHIHQLHFLLLDYMGRPAHEDFLRDTVNVPYFNGRSLAYPSVRLRMDFRDPNIVGTFRLSLPHAGARRQGHDGFDSRRCRPEIHSHKRDSMQQPGPGRCEWRK